MMLGTAPAAVLAPAGFFMRGRVSMLGWLAYTLILWLVAALRLIAGLRLPPFTDRGRTPSSLEAASFEPDPVSPAKACLELVEAAGAGDDRRSIQTGSPA